MTGTAGVGSASRRSVPEPREAASPSSPSSLSSWQSVLRRAEIFRDVDGADVEALLQHFEPQRLRNGQVVFSQGEPGEHLFVVVSGRVTISRAEAGLPRAALAVLGPADMFGELSVFDPGPRTSSATAASVAEVACLERDAMLAWVDTRPEIARRLLQVLARRLRRTNASLSDLVFVDVPGRLARVLLDLHQRFGSPDVPGAPVEHGLTQSQLAELVGSSRETVNKALSEFAHRGWVVIGQRRLQVLDVPALTRRARLPLP